MAVLTIVQEPPKFQSAYKPLLVGVTSLRSPSNGMPGEAANVNFVRAATASDVTTYGNGLEEGDIIVVHGAILPPLDVGQHVHVDSGSYDSVYRTLKIINPSVTVIESEDLGEFNGGRIEKYYENYRLVALVTLENAAEPIRFDLEADEDGVFVLPVHKAAQYTFGDVFKLANGGEPLEFIKANRYITQQWSVTFSEAYMVPDDNAINVYTEFGKDGATAALSGKIAVNSVQPYHHIDELTGEPDHQWMDDLDDYQINASSGTDQRFLTYAPRGGTTSYDMRNSMRLSSSDDYWLAILHQTGEAGRLDLRMVFFNAQNNIVGQTDQDYSIEAGDSWLFNVGPNAITVPAGTHHYYVEFNNTPVGSYSERFHLTIDDNCRAERRFFYLNSFGALDQYTIDNREGRENNVGRTVVTKPDMALDLTSTKGDHQRRTVAIDPTRRYYATTRTESKAMARYLADELLESVDVRTVIYTGEDTTIYTKVILETDKMKVGHKGAALAFTWSLGVDNIKQRR